MRIHVIYRVNQAEGVIRSPMAASQDYVNTYSTRRVGMSECVLCGSPVGARVNPEKKPQSENKCERNSGCFARTPGRRVEILI